jgi:hypothetical protein
MLYRIFSSSGGFIGLLHCTLLLALVNRDVLGGGGGGGWKKNEFILHLNVCGIQSLFSDLSFGIQGSTTAPVQNTY